MATSVDRILARAEGRPGRVFGHNPWQLGVHVIRASVRHRVSGPAVEMSFFAMLTLVPLTVAVGAALGVVERLVGPDKVARGQDAAVGGLLLTWWLASQLFAATSRALDTAITTPTGASASASA